jgi:NitT/TauT family transport system permease protein
VRERDRAPDEHPRLPPVSQESSVRIFRFGPALIRRPAFTGGDVLVLLTIASVLYAGVRLGWNAPEVIRGPEISLDPASLPWYALLSTRRMAMAYVISLVFSVWYGYTTARSRTAERVLLSLLDVLQSVPILSFLPVVLLGLSAILPQRLAVELSAVVLIFTSQAWNMAFSVHQSMTTIPRELRETASIFRLGPWLRFRSLEMPFGAIGLIWNSMMSWAGGWFFLMAAEIFTVGARDFRLPGLGAYLQTAADAGDVPAVLAGVAALVSTIVILDQLVWRPLLVWADKFKLETVEGEERPGSWAYDLLSRSWLVRRFIAPAASALAERIDEWMIARRLANDAHEGSPSAARTRRWLFYTAAAVGLALVIAACVRAAETLSALSSDGWARIGAGLIATFGRVSAALLLAFLWTVPVGVAIATNRRLAIIMQPIIQVVASVPATALFPIFLSLLLHLPGGLNVAAVALMLTGTQWYLLFNVIAGAAAIPQDLRYTTDLLRLARWDRWRTLVLPALFPFLVTGAITAGGGAWNASIIAEYVQFGGQTHSTLGVGSLISEATGRGDYPMLLAATLAMIVAVVLLNRFLWGRLYRLAEERYRME